MKMGPATAVHLTATTGADLRLPTMHPSRLIAHPRVVFNAALSGNDPPVPSQDEASKATQEDRRNPADSTCSAVVMSPRPPNSQRNQATAIQSVVVTLAATLAEDTADAPLCASDTLRTSTMLVSLAKWP